MTEVEWRDSADFVPLLEFLNPPEEARKTRLLKCACCRLAWHLLTDPRSRTAIEATERAADGAISEESRAETERLAVAAADDISRVGTRDYDITYSREHAAEAVRDTARNAGFVALGIARWIGTALASEAEFRVKGRRYSLPRKAAYDAAQRDASYAISRSVRDIFGNPFRSVTFSPEWRTDTAVSLAHGMYNSREFGAMPILADALQDAGCDSEDILSHCRGSGTHVRGCWVVDLLLGKE